MVMSGRHLQFGGDLPDIEMKGHLKPCFNLRPNKQTLLKYDIPLILVRLRSSKRLISTQVLSQCAAFRGGTVQPINFPKTRWAGPHT